MNINYKRALHFPEAGKARSILTVVIGVVGAFIFCYYFNLYREAVRLAIYSYFDLYIPTPTEFRFHNLLSASLALSLALNTMAIYWVFSLPSNSATSFRRRKRFAITHLGFLLFFTLFIVAELYTKAGGSLFGHDVVSNRIDLHQYLPILPHLIITFLVLRIWGLLYLVFKFSKRHLLTFPAAIISIYLLGSLCSIDQEKANQAYRSTFPDVYIYTSELLLEASTKHSINFKSETINLLTQRFSPDSKELSKQLFQAIKRDQKITLDTLILLQIAHHNLTGLGTTQRISEWPFPLSCEILRQMDAFSKHDPEYRYLQEILNLQSELIFYSKENVESDLERRRQMLASRRFSPHVKYQLWLASEHLSIPSHFWGPLYPPKNVPYSNCDEYFEYRK